MTAGAFSGIRKSPPNDIECRLASFCLADRIAAALFSHSFAHLVHLTSDKCFNITFQQLRMSEVRVKLLQWWLSNLRAKKVLGLNPSHAFLHCV